jgi:putative ABC transport system substrate-binding protein
MALSVKPRCTFIAALGSAAAWPLVVRAQSQRVRRIGVLMSVDDADNRASYAAFVEALQRWGWTDGRNVQIETRWPGSRASDYRRDATDLVAFAPDVLVAAGAVSLAPLLQATHTVPIVFATVTDPVGAGFIESMAHPGGNATGFAASEYTLGGKWLELLKEIAPSMRRTAVLRDPALTIGIGQSAAIQSVASARVAM